MLSQVSNGFPKLMQEPSSGEIRYARFWDKIDPVGVSPPFRLLFAVAYCDFGKRTVTCF